MSTHQAVILDVDGTLCDVRELRRHAWDAAKWHEESSDCPPTPVGVEAAYSAHGRGQALIIATARPDRYRTLTLGWLAQNLPVPVEALYMRCDGDRRVDQTIKREFLWHIRAVGYQVVRAYDDKPAVLAMWRAAGIPTTAVRGFV